MEDRRPEKAKEREKEKEKGKETEEKEKGKEKEEAPNTDNGERKRKRGKNWEWDDSYQLLLLARQHGKNWDKILLIMHNEQHRIPQISDPDKLRSHFNTLNGKDGVRKPYTAPKLRIVGKKQMTPEEIKKKEAEFAAEQEKIRLVLLAFQQIQPNLTIPKYSREREHAVTLLEEIEVREQLLHADAKASEEEIRSRMEERAAERRKVREERLAKVEEAAELDREYKRLMCSALRDVIAMLKESARREEELIAAIHAPPPPQPPAQPAQSTRPRKRRRRNEDEENEEPEGEGN